jgi:hypothetical protein
MVLIKWNRFKKKKKKAFRGCVSAYFFNHYDITKWVPICLYKYSLCEKYYILRYQWFILNWEREIPWLQWSASVLQFTWKYAIITTCVCESDINNNNSNNNNNNVNKGSNNNNMNGLIQTPCLISFTGEMVYSAQLVWFSDVIGFLIDRESKKASFNSDHKLKVPKYPMGLFCTIFFFFFFYYNTFFFFTFFHSLSFSFSNTHLFFLLFFYFWLL